MHTNVKAGSAFLLYFDEEYGIRKGEYISFGLTPSANLDNQRFFLSLHDIEGLHRRL
jgi:hypothetical protein